MLARAGEHSIKSNMRPYFTQQAKHLFLASITLYMHWHHEKPSKTNPEKTELG
jgi:hypothetical protein